MAAHRSVEGERDLRIVALAAAGAASWLVVASAGAALASFGRGVPRLGALLPYSASGPDALAATLALVATLALRAADDGARRGRAWLRFAALTQLVGAWCVLGISWVVAHTAVALPSALRVTSALGDAAPLLEGAAFGAVAIGIATFARRARGARRRALSRWSACVAMGGVGPLLGSALALGGVGLAPFVAALVVDVPSLALWVGTAGALLSLAAERRADRAPLAASCELGAIAAALVAVTSGCHLLAWSLATSGGPSTSWLAQLGTIATCAAWGLAVVALGGAAWKGPRLRAYAA